MNKLYGLILPFLMVIWGGLGLNAQTYCTPEGTNSSRYINDFSTTGGIQNITNNGSVFSTGGYGDFTSLIVSQEINGTVNFSAAISGGIAGFRIWVDWNQDGTFHTVDEVAYQSNGYSSSHSGSFQVPPTALTGSTRMRVVSHWLSTTGNIDPCATGFTYGEFEDYTFNVIPSSSTPSSCTPDMTINTTTYSNTGLTTCGFGNDFSSSDACGSVYMGGEDIVIAYTPTTSGCVNIALTNTGTWTGVFVLDNCPNIAGANCLANNTNSSGNPSINGFSVTAGSTYYIVVSTWPSPNCTAFDLDITSCPPPPPNDECSGAISVPVNSDLNCGNVTSGTIHLATPSSQVNDCYGTANDDVWFSFIATNTVHYIDLLNVSGSPTDLYHSVYGGTCGSIGSPLVCSDPNNSVVSGLTPGNMYFIRVYSYFTNSNPTTTFNICVGTPPPPPSNDECSGAISVPVNPDLNCGNVTAGTIHLATPSSQVNDCYGTANDDVWFSFVATNTVHHIDLLNVSGSTTDLYHSVYGGTCNSIGSPLVCSDPNNSVVSGLTPGYTYYIRVYSWSSSSGATTNFNVCVGTPPPPPPPPSNEECSGAIELPCGTTNLAGTTVNTTNISDPINCASSYGVWYKFTGDGQETTISSTATFDHEMVISSGSCGSLTNIVCRDGSTGTETYTFTTTSGTQYYVYIGHWSTSSSTTGTFTISRTCPSNTGDDIIPTVCTNQTFTLQAGSSLHFYDDGGPGGSCNTDEAPGNFANAGCETITTICAAPGEYLIADFFVFSMFNTDSGFDWMVIYDGPNTSSPILFDNQAGAPDNPIGTDCTYNGGLTPCATGRCLTFRFKGTTVVSREGWDALITSTPVQCSPLPVELSHFSANCDKHVILSWATESELNSEKFIVEKSRSGAHWEVVDEVDAAGNSNSHLAYSLTDYNQYGGISYYRLRQVDFDGKEEVFGPISANCEGIDNSMIAYPNPNNGNFTVEINSSVEINDAVIQLADMTGKIVSSQVVQVANGVSQISIEKSEYLNRGTYVLKVLNAEKYFSPIKVVVR